MKKNRPERQKNQTELQRKNTEWSRPKRKRAQSSRKRMVTAIPLRGVAVLGRSAYRKNAAKDDVQNSTFMESVSNFEELPYEEINLQNELSKLRRYQSRLKSSRSEEEYVDVVCQVFEIWQKFSDRLHIARVRRLEISDKQNYFMEEYYRAVEDFEQLKRVLHRIFISTFESPWLEALSKRLGKLFFLRMNAFYIMKNLGFRLELEDEEKIITRIREEQSNIPLNAAVTVNLKQQDILFDSLLRIREKIREGMGFDNYYSFIWEKECYSDISREKLVALRENIKKYILPIHREKVKSFGLERLEEDIQHHMESMASYLSAGQQSHRYETFAENFREYYERIWGDEDWELRHIEEIMEDEDGLTRNRLEPGVYPASPTFMVFEPAETVFEKLSTIVDNIVSRTNRNYLAKLGSLGYIRLDFRKSAEDINVVQIFRSSLPLVSGAYHLSSGFISRLIRVFGEAYALLLQNENASELNRQFDIPYEHRRFWGLGMEMLSLEHMESFFGENALLYAKERLYRFIRKLLHACMIDEFEENIYSRADMQMQERLELWKDLRKRYNLELYTDDVFWMNQDSMEALLEHPCSSMARILPDFMAMNLWGKSLGNLHQARDFYEHFCEHSLSNTFIEELRLAGFSSPFDIAVVKKMAFQLASYLEKDE